MAAIPHINNRRNGIWYYERRVPSEIVALPDEHRRLFGGKALWRKSLCTRRELEALERGLIAAREFEAILAGAQLRAAAARERQQPIGANETKILTPDEYKMIAHVERSRIATPWQILSVRANNRPSVADKFDLDAATYRAARDEMISLVRKRGYEAPADSQFLSPLSRAKEINGEAAYYMDESSDRFGVLVSSVREGMLQADQDIIAILNGALVSPESASPLIRDAEKINMSRARRSPKISEVVLEFIDVGGSKGRLASRTVVAAKQALNEFVKIIGDKELHLIDRSDVQRFVRIQSETSVGGKSRGSIHRSLSPTTIRKKLTFLRSPVAMAIEHGRYDGANPFADIRLGGLVKAVDRAVMSEKRAFEAPELSALFKYPWFHGAAGMGDNAAHAIGDCKLDDSRFWGPVVALYTGCRAAELGGLMLSEVRLDDPSPHLIIQPNRYRGTKSDKLRRVPILDALVGLGFGSYLVRMKSSGVDRLFPDWLPAGSGKASDSQDARWAAAKWPRAFNRTVIPLALKDFHIEGARRSVTLHSFRGSFKRMLEYANVPQQYVDDILGHAKHDLDQRYSGLTSIERLYEAVGKLDYTGLTIESR